MITISASTTAKLAMIRQRIVRFFMCDGSQRWLAHGKSSGSTVLAALGRACAGSHSGSQLFSTEQLGRAVQNAHVEGARSVQYGTARSRTCGYRIRGEASHHGRRRKERVNRAQCRLHTKVLQTRLTATSTSGTPKRCSRPGALQSAIFNSANFSSIATDAKGVIQIFNVGAERMLGYTAAEVMNKITPADISDPQEVIARAKALSVELGTPITPGFEALVFKASRGIEDIYELTYIRKDGSRFPAVVSVTALRDAQDAIIGYLLIGTDNTARKQAEEALLKAGALQSAIFNSANFSSIATDAKGVIQIFNVGAERMLGYTAAEVMNKITPADISDPQEVIARAKALSVELGTPITPGFEALVFKASRGIEDIYELTYIRKDGSRFPAVVSVTALRDAQDAIIGYLLIGTDNTARKQVEEERQKLDQRLRDQHFYTRSLIESNIDALMTTDPRGIITDVNKQTEALTGCTRDELIGAPFKNYFTDPGRAEAGINRVLTEGKVTNYELTARARDGTLTVVSYNATTFHDRDRQPAGRVRRGARHDGAEALRADAAAEERRAGRREPHEVRVPRQHVARAADAAERHHRLLRGAPRRPDRRDDRPAARVHRRHLQQRQASALADQRHPRPVEGRSRQDDARPRAGAGVVAVRRTACRSSGRRPRPATSA